MARHRPHARCGPSSDCSNYAAARVALGESYARRAGGGDHRGPGLAVRRPLGPRWPTLRWLLVGLAECRRGVTSDATFRTVGDLHADRVEGTHPSIPQR